MQRSFSYSKIYRTIVIALKGAPLNRSSLISAVIDKMGLSNEEMNDISAGSTLSNLRSRIGATVNQMHSEGLIELDRNERYYATSDAPVIVRIEKCEKEILSLITKEALTKSELRRRLEELIGTNKTLTTRDDDILSTYMGHILKRFVGEGILTLEGGVYSLSPKISACADDVNAMLALKSDFISKIHSKGGEFFENYFVTLMKKYYTKKGKQVLEAYVKGGAQDGGIDGVIKTRDELGFIETVMIQTKNRVDISSETDVRGFYGAVCACKGSRGIFATSSDFHASAKEFMKGIDDLVGIGGDRLFSLAIECSYGIKKNAGAFHIDEKVFV